VIPRREITGLYRVLMQDDGEVAAELLGYPKKVVAKLPLRLQYGRALLLSARNPRLALLGMEQVADRLEGTPVQKLRHEVPHVTYFYGSRRRATARAPHAVRPARCRRTRS
jgi:hypothetical protein